MVNSFCTSILPVSVDKKQLCHNYSINIEYYVVHRHVMATRCYSIDAKQEQMYNISLYIICIIYNIMFS